MRNAFKCHPKMIVFDAPNMGFQCDETKVTFGIKGFNAEEVDSMLKNPKVGVRCGVSS